MPIDSQVDIEKYPKKTDFFGSGIGTARHKFYVFRSFIDS